MPPALDASPRSTPRGPSDHTPGPQCRVPPRTRASGPIRRDADTFRPKDREASLPRRPVFVTDRIEAAAAQAKELAGDKNVAVNGGQMARQCLDAGLLDEVGVELVPVVLGGGTPLFADLGATPVDFEVPVAVVQGTGSRTCTTGSRSRPDAQQRQLLLVGGTDAYAFLARCVHKINSMTQPRHHRAPVDPAGPPIDKINWTPGHGVHAVEQPTDHHRLAEIPLFERNQHLVADLRHDLPAASLPGSAWTERTRP